MDERGYTLVELVVTIGIAAILLALVTLNFHGYLGKANAESQAKQLYADLQDARSKAVFTKHRYSVDFSGQQAVTRRFASDTDATGTVQSTKNLPLAVSASWTPPNIITFDTQGLMGDPARVICIATTDNAAYDAVIVTTVTTYLGKVVDRGAPCDISNVVKK